MRIKRALTLMVVVLILAVSCAGPASPAPAAPAAPAAPQAAPTTAPAAPQATAAPQAGGAAGQTVAELDAKYPRPEKPAKEYRVGVLLPHLSNPHFVGQAYGYIDEGEKLGVKVTLLEAGGYQYVDKQVSQMEDLIASKVDAIILVATNGAGTVAVVDEAVAAGIPVINANVMTNNKNVVARIRSDDTVIGQMQGDYMCEVLKGNGKVVMLRGAPGTSWAETRGNSFKQRLAEKCPGVQAEGEQYSQSTPADGLKVMEDFLQTYPQIDGVYNGADTTAIGAAQAIVAAGKGGKIAITTTDFQPDCEKFVREGVISGAVVQQTVLIGRWAMRATVNHLENKDVPAELNTPLLLVTKDNVGTVDLTGARAPDGWKPPTAQ